MKIPYIVLICLAASATQAQPGDAMTEADRTETATFAGGCFWCIEEIFRQQPGVRRVTSGYTGGHVENPTYAQVCSGTTGHAEAIRVEFDPQGISYRSLLDVFWKAHDPTQLNRQGADVGTQYRSAVFTHSEAQAAAARESLEAEEASGRHARKIVTEITPAPVFWPAEDYHQRYYQKKGSTPYCHMRVRRF